MKKMNRRDDANPNHEVATYALAQLRTFLDNLANGTRDYAKVDSATRQVAHQYEGRAAVELLQNAHDALSTGPSGGPGADGRVRFALADDGAHGVLYVANDGRPLRYEDVEGLAELGLSPKSPAEAIGNKGFGFRSVLELTDQPEVFSKRSPASPVFDGYGVRFAVDVHDLAREAAHALLAIGGVPDDPFGSGEPLVDWSNGQRARYRARVGEEDADWLDEQIRHLSPYSIPTPVLAPEDAIPFARDGFSTVVRLPLRSAAAAAEAERQLQALIEEGRDVGLFLPALRVLEVRLPNNTWTLRRQRRPRRDARGGDEITLHIEHGDTTERRRFWAWRRTVGGAADPEAGDAIRAATAGLPGRWPEVDEAQVWVAVERAERPRSGRYSIFLPTDERTGSSALISAPFYGGIERRRIDFAKPLNALLARAAGTLIADVALDALVGGGRAEAETLVDLLAGADEGRLGVREALARRAEARGCGLAELPLAFTSKGWTPMGQARVAEPLPEPAVLDAAAVERLAPFALIAPTLGHRLAAAERLLRDCTDLAHPTPKELAELVERAATALHAGALRGDWNGFWHDVEALLDGDLEALRDRAVLLAEDGRLLRPSGPSSPVEVFFPPVQGEGVERVADVPPALQPLVAFLSSRIALQEQTSLGRRQSAARRALESLVAVYDAPTLYRRVVRPSIPHLPAPRPGQHDELCAGLLRWAADLTAKREDVGDLGLGRLPVPCRGGWFPADEAMFGPGWPDGAGADLLRYLRDADTSPARETLRRLVLAPKHNAWGRGWAQEDLYDFLGRAGVVDGLRLEEAVWNGAVWLSEADGAQLPNEPPPGLSPAQWATVRPLVTSETGRLRKYVGAYAYAWAPLWTLPGLEAFDRLSDAGRDAFSRLLLHSLPMWEHEHRRSLRGSGAVVSWRTARLSKLGGDPHSFSLISPLGRALRALPWLRGGSRAQPPSGWWILPPRWTAEAGAEAVAYLHPVPSTDPATLDALERLGTPRLPPEGRTPAAGRFLEAVADACATDAAAPTALVAHAREGWRRFEPKSSGDWPRRLLVRARGGQIDRWTPDAGAPCYLPGDDLGLNEALAAHGHPTLVVDAADTGRLVEAGVMRAYVGAVRSAASIRADVLVDGAPWKGDTPGLRPLAEPPLDWLPELALSALAFGGGAEHGVHSPSFGRAAAALRRAHAAAVGRLETVLTDEGRPLTSPRPVGAWWSAVADGALLIAREAPLNVLAEPLLTALRGAGADAPHLALALKLALRTLEQAGTVPDQEPAPDALTRALAEIGVDADRRREVRLHLHGGLAWALDRAVALLALAGVRSPQRAVDGVHDAGGLRHLLARHSLPGMSPDDAFALVRDARSDTDLGRQLYDRLGAAAELEAWNAALRRVGRAPVHHADAGREAAAHRAEALPLARAALRHAAIAGGDPSHYEGSRSALEGATPPADLDVRFWSVPFSVVVAPLAAVLNHVGVPPPLVHAIEAAASAEVLRRALEGLGVDVRDPEAVREDNARAARMAAVRLWLVAAARAVRADQEPPPMEAIEAAADRAVQLLGFDEPWTAEEALRRVAAALPDSDPAVVAAREAADEADLLQRLGLSPADLDRVEEDLRAREAAARRRRQTVTVAGLPFYAGEENLGRLWDHLEQTVPEDTLSELHLDRPVNLGPAPGGSRRKGTGGPPGAPKGSRAPQWRRDLVGLAGEIHAYRILRRTYGSAVGPSAWVSKYRRHNYSDGGDDRHGYDLAFTAGGICHFVEVKASEGDLEAFEMGPSEVETARRVARSSRERYVIVRVTQALSKDPCFAVLPNPFGADAAGHYRVEERGVKVRFRTAST